MAVATIIKTGHDLDMSSKIRAFARRILGLGYEARASGDFAVPTSNTEHIAELLEKIEHGYIVEETGEHARIPHYARTHLKTLVANGDWG